jgi:hypothetical protein
MQLTLIDNNEIEFGKNCEQLNIFKAELYNKGTDGDGSPLLHIEIPDCFQNEQGVWDIDDYENIINGPCISGSLKDLLNEYLEDDLFQGNRKNAELFIEWLREYANRIEHQLTMYDQINEP